MRAEASTREGKTSAMVHGVRARHGGASTLRRHFQENNSDS